MNQRQVNKSIAILLCLVMLTSIFASETLSRFTTSVTSSDSSRIAYWGINEGPVTMDLFDGEYFRNDDEADIVLARSHDGDNIIAPGFGKQSEFGILVHESTIAPEVAYELKITLDDSEIDQLIKDNASIQWKLNNGAWGTFDQLKSSLLALSGDPSGYKIYQPGELIQNFRQGEINTIAWQWVDDDTNNAADTELADYVDFDKTNVNLEVTISAVQYLGVSSMLNATSTFNLNDENAVLSFRSAAPVGELQKVKVDGNVVAPENYEVIEGSTIIKFKDSYARSLSIGNHVIEIVSQNMTAKTNFKIEDGDSDLGPDLFGTVEHYGIIPEGGIYYKNIQPVSLEDDEGFEYEAYLVGNYNNATVYTAGQSFPELEDGDAYVYGNYEYRYNMEYCGDTWCEYPDQNGWSVTYHGNESIPMNLIENINDGKLVSINSVFSGNSNIRIAPAIPNTVVYMSYAFDSCENLETVSLIPESVKYADYAFYDCINLTGDIEINFDFYYYDDIFDGTEKQINIFGKNEKKLRSLAKDYDNIEYIGNITTSSVLSENDWETIYEVTKRGQASNYWSVGDKTIIDYEGDPVEVVIIGIDHDGENTVTFMFNEAITNDTYGYEADDNSLGWKDNWLRSDLQEELSWRIDYEGGFKRVEKKTIKGYGAGGEQDALSLVTSNDNLFLLSYTEIFGGNLGEGKQYEYFKNEHSKVIKHRNSGNIVSWWLRTPSETNSTDYYVIDTDGNLTTKSFNTSNALVPAFIIG